MIIWRAIRSQPATALWVVMAVVAVVVTLVVTLHARAQVDPGITLVR